MELNDFRGIMKQVTVYHRKDLVERLKKAIYPESVFDTLNLYAFLGQYKRLGTRAQILRQFRNKFKIYETF